VAQDREVIDYVLEVKPRRSFATHEKLRGRQAMANAASQWATEQNGGEFLPLEPGDAIYL